MKTSELVEQLMQSLDDNGDIEVSVHVFDGVMGAFEEITGLEVTQLKGEENKLEIKHAPLL